MSNLGQSGGRAAQLGLDRAQAFTTGNHSPGYLLEEVDVEVSVWTASTTLTVTVNRASGTVPGASLGTLTTAQLGTAFPSSRTVVFAAPGDGIDLDPDTTYFVVFDAAVGDSSSDLSTTGSDSEDAGAADGFTIADSSGYLLGGTWGQSTASLRIAVKGSAKTAPITPDAPSAVIHEPFPRPRYIAVQRGDVCDAAASRTWQDFSDLVDPWRDTMHGWRCVTWQRDHHRNTN